MHRRLDHARKNLHRRIARETQSESRYPLYTHDIRRSLKTARKWLRDKYGKHPGKCLPEMLHKDPRHVIETLFLIGKAFDPILMLCPNRFKVRWAHQTQVLANRWQNIRLPKSKRETHQFAAVIDRKGVFERLVVLRLGKTLTKASLNGSKIVKLGPTLNLEIPYRFNNPEVGLKRMMRSFKEIFFRQAPEEVDPKDYLRFFSDRKNFDTSKCISHTSVVMTVADTEALMKIYRQRLRRH